MELEQHGNYKENYTNNICMLFIICNSIWNHLYY